MQIQSSKYYRKMFLVFCLPEVGFFHLTSFKGGLAQKAQRDSEDTAAAVPSSCDDEFPFTKC